MELRYCAEREFSIGVAAGASKHPVVRACIRARYFNVLVTDEATARFLLEGKSNPTFQRNVESTMNVAEIVLPSKGHNRPRNPGACLWRRIGFESVGVNASAVERRAATLDHTSVGQEGISGGLAW